MPPKDRMKCEKCGRLRKIATDFYKDKHGEVYPVCRTCLTANIDNRNPDTFTWILKELDMPYVEPVWVKIANQEFIKNPKNFGPKTVIGKYMRTMRTQQYANKFWADSDELTQIEGNKESTAKQESAYAKKAYERLEKGEITPEEYAAMTSISIDDITLPEVVKAPDPISNSMANMILDPVGENERKVLQNLSEEEHQYLILKWGVNYKASELVQLESMYERYSAENDLNVDREEALKKICKTSLKMDTALDNEDYASYASLSKVYDTLRKSSKFTESQKKDQSERVVDSIGELVAYVERESGAIPMQDSPLTFPQDKVDFIMKDMHNYVNRLVRDELGLGDLIESFIERQKANQELAEKEKAAFIGNSVEEEFTPVVPEITDPVLPPVEEYVRDVMPAPVKDTTLQAVSFKDYYMLGAVDPEYHASERLETQRKRREREKRETEEKEKEEGKEQ